MAPDAAGEALTNGAPVLVDAPMVAQGIQRPASGRRAGDLPAAR